MQSSILRHNLSHCWSSFPQICTSIEIGVALPTCPGSKFTLLSPCVIVAEPCSPRGSHPSLGCWWVLWVPWLLLPTLAGLRGAHYTPKVLNQAWLGFSCLCQPECREPENLVRTRTVSKIGKVWGKEHVQQGNSDLAKNFLTLNRSHLYTQPKWVIRVYCCYWQHRGRTKINALLFEGIKEEIRANERTELDFLLPNISLKSANK